MVIYQFNDIDLLSVEQQVVLLEKGGLNACMTRTQSALNREYQRKSISTKQYVELSRRLRAVVK